MTRDEIMAMTAEELRVAIAKKRGYPYPYDKYRVPVSKPIMLDAPYDAQPIPDFRVELRDVPDYPHDIAAAWELEESVPENQHAEYELCLYFAIGKGEDWTFWDLNHATAEQKSRAYMIWSEESGK